MPGFSVKIKSKKGQFILKDLTEATTIGDLKTQIILLTDIAPEQLHTLIGFPPRPLDLSADTDSISTVGIKSGETLIVEQKAAAVASASAAAAAQPSIEDDEALARRLQAEEEEEAAAAASAAAAAANQPGGGHLSQLLQTPYESFTLAARLPVGQHNGVLLKKVVAADNSCLFTSIRYVMKGHIDNEGSELMRHMIADTVSKNSQQFNDAMLGKTNEEYCAWIQKPESWGGAIEVAILSKYYGVEIDVVDIQNVIINRFGEDMNYKLRVFLLFDGIHYDPLYMQVPNVSGPITVFPVAEMSVYRMAEQLATEAKQARQFTNVDKFSVRCLQCDKKLVGQVQAQDHAEKTGHNKFDEI